MDAKTWHRVQALIASNTRSNARTSSPRKNRTGVRRSENTRYPLAGLVICDACGKKLQGIMVRGHAFNRCKVSRDYPVPPDNHPANVAVREDRLVPHVDHRLCELFAPDRVEATAAEVVEADAEGRREDAAIVRALLALIECERKLAKHLDGLEAGIDAEVIAPRIAAAQREKDAAEAVLATAPPTPKPLALAEVVETLSALHTLPELLERIEQADRAALYQALGLTVRYRRVGTSEEVKLTSILRSVDLERVVESPTSRNPLVAASQGVDLKRVGGGTGHNAVSAFDAYPAWGSSHVGARFGGNPVREVGTTELWLPAA